jgi:exonuclease SbcC
MELTKLSLTNFRSHRKLELDFTSGITGIVGDNGKGKSSIVEAIIFLFTGEGYGAKSDMISVGESTGYVVGQLRIDGKEATLERHLDTSKVAFKYEGVTYKKSGEVAEIWDRLFQIDKNIFKNIVVAKQGDIALLFSGDNSVKEKIFQKIFLVPNTTKIRDTIWNKYIKAAPPEYPETDLQELERNIKDTEQRLKHGEETLKLIPDDLSERLAQALSRQTYLESCAAASSNREAISGKITSLERDIAESIEKEKRLKDKLETVNLEEITSTLEMLKNSKPLWEKRVILEEKLRELERTNPDWTEENSSRVEELKELVAKKAAELSVYTDELNGVNKTLSDYRSKGLIDSANCPTCGASLADSQAYISHLEAKIPHLTETISGRKQEVNNLQFELSGLVARKTSWDKNQSEIASTKASILPIKDAAFDQGTHDLLAAVLVQSKQLSEEIKNLQASRSTKQEELQKEQIKLLSLPTYDNAKGSVEYEYPEVIKRVAEIREMTNTRNTLTAEGMRDRLVLETYQKHKTEAIETVEKNRRRRSYVGILEELYEMLHTSEFPRKLIQTYSSTVSEYLTDNLRQFNFPYRAEVNDNFGIDVFDDRGRKLPSVSGGQEIMIGVALRLALHAMFGSAFPMMIFDEGSVHLSQESKRSYFEIIQNMKNMNNFKQVIIIDHDEDLAGVVDNTIKL